MAARKEERSYRSGFDERWGQSPAAAGCSGTRRVAEGVIALIYRRHRCDNKEGYCDNGHEKTENGKLAKVLLHYLVETEHVETEYVSL